jgi:hypothetical protein
MVLPGLYYKIGYLSDCFETVFATDGTKEMDCCTYCSFQAQRG